MLTLAEVPEDPNNLAAVAKPCHVAGDSLWMEDIFELAGVWRYESLTWLSSANVMTGAEVRTPNVEIGWSPKAAPEDSWVAILPMNAHTNRTE